jgi:hypothetical protein
MSDHRRTSAVWTDTGHDGHTLKGGVCPVRYVRSHRHARHHRTLSAVSPTSGLSGEQWAFSSFILGLVDNRLGHHQPVLSLANSASFGVPPEHDNRCLIHPKALNRLTISIGSNHLGPDVCPNSTHQGLSASLCAPGQRRIELPASDHAMAGEARRKKAYVVGIAKQIDRGTGAGGPPLARSGYYRSARSLQKILTEKVW